MVWTKTGPVSAESRLNRIYPQVESAGITPFIWRIQSEPGSFFIATGSKVYIRSSITETIP